MPDETDGPDVLPACVCGHPVTAHEHYRDGTECAICGRVRCWAYRPDRPAISAELRRVLLVLAAAPGGVLGLIALGTWVSGWAVFAVLAVATVSATGWSLLSRRRHEEP